MTLDIAGLKKLVGTQVDAYHDGKASPSRLVRVVIDDVGTRDDLDPTERRLWREALAKDFDAVFGGCVRYLRDDGTETRQFWDWNCDLFIGGHILYDERTIRDPMLFAMRPDGFGWYGVNWNYSLDPEGRIRAETLQHWEKCADGRGLRMEWDPDAGMYRYFDKKTGLPAN